MLDFEIGLIDQPVVVIWGMLCCVQQDHGSSHGAWYDACIEPTMS